MKVEGQGQRACNPCSNCDFDKEKCNSDNSCVYMPLTGNCQNKNSEEKGCDADVLYGGVRFHKIGEEDTTSHGCKDRNVYEREGAVGSRICFKESVGSMQRECSDEATNNFVNVNNIKFVGTVLTTYRNVRSASACLRACQLHGVYGAGFSYDTGEQGPTSKDCIIFSTIEGQITVADWVSYYCRGSGDDSCISEAMSIGITHCSDDCEGSEENCATCISEKLEGKCSNKEEFSFLWGGEPWKCLYDVPKCVAQCVTESLNPADIANCAIHCVPDECVKYVCDALGKWPTAKKACICSPTLIPIVQKCRQDNPDSWPNTVECIVEQVLDGPCISVLCDLLKYVLPEVPEAVQLCNCAIPIISSVNKCHDQYGSDWVKVVECVAKTVGKDCEKYLCKYAGKIFPPILQVPFCK